MTDTRAPWFTDSIPERQAELLRLMALHEHDPIEWSIVTSTDELGNVAEIPVMADSLSFDGVRVTADYRTTQLGADAMGLYLATPWIVGLVSEQATRRPSYTAPQPPSTTRAQTINTSDQVTAKLLGATEGLAVNPSKWWVLSRAIIDRNKPTAAINHGLFTGAWDPVQNVGTAHNLEHVDNTQALRFVGARSRVIPASGAPFELPTGDLYMSADWGHLASGRRNHIRGRQVGEGPLPWDHHPAIPRPETDTDEGT
jgi:hypothetical protein